MACDCLSSGVTDQSRNEGAEESLPAGGPLDFVYLFPIAEHVKARSSVSYVALVESETGFCRTSRMRSSSVEGRGESVLFDRHVCSAGLHMGGLSLAEYVGCSGDGVWMRLEGQRLVVLGFAVRARVTRYPK